MRVRVRVRVSKHAYLQGGLDTAEVADSFARLHEGQQNFKSSLDTILPHRGDRASRQPATPSGGGGAGGGSEGSGASGSGGGGGGGGGAAGVGSPGPSGAFFGRQHTLSEKRAEVAAQRRTSMSPDGF